MAHHCMETPFLRIIAVAKPWTKGVSKTVDILACVEGMFFTGGGLFGMPHGTSVDSQLNNIDIHSTNIY